MHSVNEIHSCRGDLRSFIHNFMELLSWFPPLYNPLASHSSPKSWDFSFPTLLGASLSASGNNQWNRERKKSMSIFPYTPGNHLASLVTTSLQRLRCLLQATNSRLHWYQQNFPGGWVRRWKKKRKNKRFPPLWLSSPPFSLYKPKKELLLEHFFSASTVLVHLGLPLSQSR